MKFTLTYDGLLDSAGNKSKKEEKWAIRKQLDPQLRRLWDVNLDLRGLRQDSTVRADGRYIVMKPHHTAFVTNATMSPAVSMAMLPPSSAPPPPPEWVDLCAPVARGGKRFFPLVRDSLALTCTLKIQFLRQEPKGRIYQGGDLDGRIKLLLDALSVPQNDNEVCDDPQSPDPLYCVVEDDALVTGVDVQSERLLAAGPADDEKLVRLIIGVDVRVVRARTYNEMFLSD